MSSKLLKSITVRWILKISIWGLIISNCITICLRLCMSYFSQWAGSWYIFSGDSYYIISIFFFYSFLREKRGFFGLISDILMFFIIRKFFLFNGDGTPQYFYFLLLFFIILIRFNDNLLFNKINFTEQLKLLLNILIKIISVLIIVELISIGIDEFSYLIRGFVKHNETIYQEIPGSGGTGYKCIYPDGSSMITGYNPYHQHFYSIIEFVWTPFYYGFFASFFYAYAFSSKSN